MGEADAPLLLEILASPSANSSYNTRRDSAVLTLSKMGEKVRRKLSEDLRTGSQHFDGEIAGTIAEMTPPSAEYVASNTASEHRFASAFRELISERLKVGEEPDPVCGYAAEALGALGDSESTPLLIELLGRSPYAYAVIDRLARIHDPLAVAALAGCVADRT
jgi:hypothetical protein